MDILVPVSRKNAANCDKQCELQNSASHQIFERSSRAIGVKRLLASLLQCLIDYYQIKMWLNPRVRSM